MGQILPYDMFDATESAAEARRSEKLQRIYHRGQSQAWVGTQILSELVAKHGGIHMPAESRRPLAKIFSILMWGELAAWRISAQLSDRLVPLGAKMAATSQAFDEARHFYVLHDYLLALGAVPERPDPHTEAALRMVLETRHVAHKLIGMQLMIEPIALTIFHAVRHLEIEPVLSELLGYYEKDEARHVGLGVQSLPMLFSKMSRREHTRMFLFQMKILYHVLRSLKHLEPDLLALGMEPRDLLELGMGKQEKAFQLLGRELGVETTLPKEIARRTIGAAVEIVFPKAKLDLWAKVSRAAQVLRHGRDVTDVPLTEMQ